MSLITVAEYRQRAARLRESMGANGFNAFILFSDVIRISNVKYLVDFTPIRGYSDIAMAVVLLPAKGEPTLYVSTMNLLWGEEVAWFPARPFSELSSGLLDLRRSLGGRGKIGVAGSSFMPVPVHQVIAGAFALSDIEIAPAEPVMARLKAKKTPAEVEMFRKAGELTVFGLDAVKRAVTGSDGKMTEREIANFVTSEMFRVGDGPSFDVQIQSGIHASYNNIRSTEKVVKPGDSILIEMGANYRDYLTDIARGATYGPVNPRQIEIIEVAAAAQQAGCDAAKPGITADELNQVIVDVLVDRGYVEYSSEARGYGTGHGAGTDVEEEEPWIKPGSRFVLEEGMVMALKASIFVPALAGVRIEDCVLVTANGAENLTPYPKVSVW
jgi:Xaa-Pro aminopeptidase